MRIFITIACFLMAHLAFSQDQEQYDEQVKEAWQLYEAKDYKAAANRYKIAFDAMQGKAYPNDRYNAACSYALAGNVDSSFYHLFYLAENPNIQYKNLPHISTDADLTSLHAEERRSNLLSIVKANKEAYEKNFDVPLMTQLDSIYELDQNYRRQIGEIEEKYGRESEEMSTHWDLIQQTDSINLIAITKILDERGWLGADVIGGRGNSTLFLVIQHADLETQVKYLPMMREAVSAGNAKASSLALLEDRVALRQGKRQIYGSQVGRDQETGAYFVSPLIEPEKVNERRAEVGLGTIEDYISHWDMTWDVEKHKARTANMEAEEKK